MSEPFWSALGARAGAGGVDYEGVWSAGTAYVAGDVVRYNGIDYLAVNPSTGVVPPTSGIPGGELAYAERTTNLTITPTTEATAVEIVAVNVTVDGQTDVVIDGYCPSLGLGAHASGNFCVFVLYQDGVSIGKLGDFGTAGNIQMENIPRLARRFRPSAGAHTYSLRAYRTNADAQLTCGAGGVGAYFPAYIRVVRA